MYRKLTFILAVVFALQLVDPGDAQQSTKKPLTVAVLLFNGVELLDFAGPAEVFIVCDHGNAVR